VKTEDTQTGRQGRTERERYIYRERDREEFIEKERDRDRDRDRERQRETETETVTVTETKRNTSRKIDCAISRILDSRGQPSIRFWYVHCEETRRYDKRFKTRRKNCGSG
jgi:hypothetical protein